MTDDVTPFVEELFKKYRGNFEKLEALFVKKGFEKPYWNAQVKVKGETFYNSYYYEKSLGRDSGYLLFTF